MSSNDGKFQQWKLAYGTTPFTQETKEEAVERVLNYVMNTAKKNHYKLSLDENDDVILVLKNGKNRIHWTELQYERNPFFTYMSSSEEDATVSTIEDLEEYDVMDEVEEALRAQIGGKKRQVKEVKKNEAQAVQGIADTAFLEQYFAWKAEAESEGISFEELCALKKNSECCVFPQW